MGRYIMKRLAQLLPLLVLVSVMVFSLAHPIPVDVVDVIMDVAIFTTVLGFNLLGDGLRDVLDPRQI